MENNEIILSVMVETYNQQKYIKQTIDSILNQDYCFNYEIIVGDDCSTDKTSEILDEYAKKYPQIKVIHNEKNLGAMGNYYNVLSQVKGKYVMDCAGDDYWLPGKVKTQIEFMETHPDIGLCYGKTYPYYQKINKISKKSFGGTKTKYEELFLENTIPALTVCYRKDLVNKYISEINPKDKNWLMEDYPMWLWFSNKSIIKFLNINFGVYRIIEESESHSINYKKMIAFVNSINEIRKFFAIYFNSCELYEEYKRYNDLCSMSFRFNKLEDMNFYYSKIKDKTLKIKLKHFIINSKLINLIIRKILNILSKNYLIDNKI